MDFTLSKEQIDIRDAAKRFAEGEFDPDLAEEREKHGQFPLELFQKACALGFIGMNIPEKYGGQMLGSLENALIFEAFCRHDSSIGLALALCDTGSEVLLRYGTEAQIQRFVPPLCRGKGVLSPACLEQERDPIPERFNTKAVENGGGYLLNGHKSFVFNTTLPGPMILPGRLENISGAGGTAIFVFEKDHDGLSSSVLGDRVGMRMVPMGNVVIHDLSLPRESLLAEERDGEAALALLITEMHNRAASAGIGIAQGAFDMALGYARRRKQFGRRIASFEAIRGKLTDMAIKIELSRLLTYKACRGLDTGKENAALSNMAKLVASETALEVSMDALHIFGGYGYIVDYRIERFYRDASMVEIIGLPSLRSKKILADDVVGKRWRPDGILHEKSDKRRGSSTGGL